MKPKGTDIRKREQKRAAVKSVLFSGLFRIPGAALLLFTREHTPWPELHGLLLLLAILDLLTIPFSFVVLIQRIREIERGELDEARKY